MSVASGRVGSAPGSELRRTFIGWCELFYTDEAFFGKTLPVLGKRALFLGGREEEGEDVAEAVGPGVLVVDCADVFEVGEVDSGLPSALEEEAVELVGIADVASAFGGAHVEPDVERRAGLDAVDEGEDAAVIPPEGGRHDGEVAEDFGVFEAEEEGDEAAEGGAAEGGVGCGGQGAVGGVDEGFELFDEESAVEWTIAATHFVVAGGGVLGHAAEAGVGDADEDDGLDAVGECEFVGGGLGAPGAAGDVGGVAVEEVLAVVKVEDGEAKVGFGEVLGGEIDGDGAVVGKDGGVEVVDVVAGVVEELAGGLGMVLALDVEGAGGVLSGGAWSGERRREGFRRQVQCG